MGQDAAAGTADVQAGEHEHELGPSLHSSALGLTLPRLPGEGQSRRRIGQLQETLKGVASTLSDTTVSVATKAKAAIDRAADDVWAADQVKPFITERPYSALGVSVGIGLLFGLLIGARGPKVVYMTPRS